MRYNLLAVLAAALFVSAMPAQAQSYAYQEYAKYSAATDQAIDDIDTAADHGDKYAGCRALDRTMRNARYAANALIDLIEETKADGSLGSDERANLLQTYRDEWDQYDQLARQASNSLDACSGLAY